MDSCHEDGVARRQSSPYTGKCSARPAGRPGELFHVEAAFATIPSAPLPLSSYRINTEAPQYAFSRQGGIYRSDVVQNQKQSQNQNPRAGTDRLPLVGPEPGQKNAS